MFFRETSINSYGVGKKIDLYDKNLKYITSFDKLDDKIAYIKELWDGKILVIDLKKTIKILKLNNNIITLESTIETADERNFVGFGTTNQNIICGGNRYLTIIGRSYLFWYKMIQSLDLEGFISNIVEIDSKSFLVGQNHKKRIIMFSSENFKKLYGINNISFRGNNYSIAKISNKFVGIAGFERGEKIKACIFLLSLETKNICKKYYSDELDNFCVLSRLSNTEIIITGNDIGTKDHSSNLNILNINGNSNNEEIKKISELKDAFCDSVEAMITIKNLIIAADSSSNLKLFQVE